MAEVGASALSGLGYGVGFGTAYGSIVDILRTAVTWSKWKVLGYSMGYPIMADVMQKLLEAEKDPVHGLTSKGMVDTIWGFIDRTMDFSMIINESVATQLFIQMIQQSIAYAIHTSHAGSIGTLCNVYSGSTYLSGAESSSIGRYADFTGRQLKGFLSAEVGRNIPTLSFDFVRGANERLEEYHRKIMSDIDALLSEWNDLALSYYRHYHSMARTRLENTVEMKESVTERAYGLLEQVANEHMARISEQLDTLEGAKAWFDANLMSSDELVNIAIRLNLERGASENNYDEYKDDILGAISLAIVDWDNKISTALGDLSDNEAKYSSLIKLIFGTLFANVSDFAQTVVDVVDKAIEDVCAYRNVNKAIDVVLERETVMGDPLSPTEVEFMYWKSFEQVPEYTVVLPHYTPRTKAWESAT